MNVVYVIMHPVSLLMHGDETLCSGLECVLGMRLCVAGLECILVLRHSFTYTIRPGSDLATQSTVGTSLYINTAIDQRWLREVQFGGQSLSNRYPQTRTHNVILYYCNIIDFSSLPLGNLGMLHEGGPGYK